MKKNKANQSNVYQRVTERICELLEQGVSPWKSHCFAEVGFPANYSTRKAYRGINVFLLGSMRYTSPWFLTYLQAKELGGQVRKGEKGALVVKCGTWSRKTKTEADEAAEKEERHYLKAYTVFNACQIDGIDFPAPKPIAPQNRGRELEEAERIVQGMPKPPGIIEGRTAVPHYKLRADEVQMPGREYFGSLDRYYLSLFHELTHATGHESRLARDTLIKGSREGEAGEKRYSKEELIAEMGASFLAAFAGIDHDGHEESAAYLQGWLEVLRAKNHERWIVEAASKAQAAADYILNVKPGD